jgi:Carboxypeptidase regulatory-like domain/TonB dependent receptor-like, beta-barrel
MKRKICCGMVLVSMLLLLSGVSLAQSGSTGAVEGKVLDEEGTPLPGAEVKLSSPDLIGGIQTRLTAADGKFRFVALLRGTYTLEASLSGFSTMKRGDIRVYVGQTATVDLILKIGKLEEEVTVISTSPLVDVKDSQLNATNLDKQMIQTVGGETRAVRASSDLINLAPGIKDRSAMGASERSSNQWQLDGQSLLTFVGTGQDWQYPDINIVEEARVSGSGTNAEYGGFTGAVLNLITKSGGNTLEGMAETLYSPLAWNTKNFDTSDPMFSLFEAPPRNLFFSAHFGLGGAIVKDKLWFYVSGGFNQSDEEITGLTVRRSTQIPKGFGKLTFQLSPNDRLSASIEYEYFQVFNRGLSVTTTNDAAYYDVGPGMPVGLNWMHTFSQNTFAEVKVGFYYSWYDQRPNKGKNVSAHFDGLTGILSGNSNFWGESTSTHWTASANVSHHAEEFIKGSHDFKVGVEFLKGFDNSKYGYTGGFYYYDNYYGYSYIYYDYRYMTLAYTYGYDVKSNGWKASGFAQDSWRISDRLTINPGVRWSMQRGYLPNLQEEAFFKPKNQLEFRLGLTFDVFGDHTTALKAHYGRFHESFKTWYFNSADPGYEDWVTYEVAKDGRMLETYRKSYATNDKMDPNIQIPYSDQFTVGLERTLLKDMVISLTYIYREYKDFIAHVNTGAGWTFNPWTFENENGQDQTIDIYYRNSGTTDSYLITNPNTGVTNVLYNPKNTYSGFSIALSKRFSDGWMFHLDYTYSVTKGNQANDDSTGAWGGRAFENPNRQIRPYGYLPFDAPHALNVYGTISLPLGFVITPRLLVQSGYNWEKYVSGPKSVGRVPIRLEDRGSERVPTQVSFDLRLEKSFTITERMRLGLLFDAFNIFNRGVPTLVESNVQYVNYGKALTASAPRYLRIGARFFF